MSKPNKVAILTAGGLAPCLNSAIGSLIERYTEIDPSIEIICYRSGYKGLLLGDYYIVTPEIREKAGLLHSILFKRLHIHTVPTLHFFHDQSIERGIEMSRLIDRALQSAAPENPKEEL